MYIGLCILKKEIASGNREALWFELGNTGISITVVDCIICMYVCMYEGIHFCVKCGEDQSREDVEKVLCHTWMQFEPLFI